MNAGLVDTLEGLAFDFGVYVVHPALDGAVVLNDWHDEDDLR